MKKYYKESRRKGTSYIQQNDGRLTELVTSCVELPSKTLYWNEDRRAGTLKKKT